MKIEQQERVNRALDLLDRHYNAFYSVAETARATGHPVPTDTRGWSQIVVSILTGIRGIERKKGPDLQDGSDVKGANTWEAIDTPRFNNVIKSGTQAASSDSLRYLDQTPFLFLVLWDINSDAQQRCRIWVVRPQIDSAFRDMCALWYDARRDGQIRSSNFQLHPPRGTDLDVIRNTKGNLVYPLMLCAVRYHDKYEIQTFDSGVMDTGLCLPSQ